jgi:type II secretory pathway component GspD/PulD (secretin)
MSGLNRLLLACGVAVAALLLARGALGQEMQEITRPDGTTIQVPANLPPHVLERIRSGPGGPMPGYAPRTPGQKEEDKEGKDEEKKGEEGKEEDKEKEKTDEKKEGEKSDEKTASVKRESEPPEPGDPKELEVKPDEKGMVEFNFANQKWLGVLEWLARISNMSLDWQELPGDYLNLTTQRKHTVRETRDLINCHLLERGYTLLPVGDRLLVAKIDKLNPSLVPRVRPEELAERDPYEWVKVSFRLDWMLAEDAVKEYEPMKSPHGKLTALTATNRLEAMDAVKNLQDIYEVLQEEQLGKGDQGLVRVFHLEHTSAESVVEQVRELMGLESKSSSSSKGPPGPMTPDQMRAAAEAMKHAQEAAKKGGAPSKPTPKIQLIANKQENSILAVAPPDKLAIIEQAILALDVPRDHRGFRDRAMIRVEVYFLESIEPEPLIKTLEELGDFDYYTRLQADKENNAIIAYASLADQLTIGELIAKLDQGSRGPEVIQLETLRAESAARSIAFIMLGQKEEEEESRSRSRGSYFSPYDYFRSRSSSSRRSDDEKDQFRVDADTKTNSLYLWCNQFELAKVEDILDSLRQSQGKGGGGGEYSVQVYRLVSLDPEPFVKTLEEMETLGFRAKLEIDEENNTIIANATEADHAKIRDLIEKLDGSTREVHVIPLRRLEADYVAGTIKYLMAGKEDKEQSGYSRSYYYYDFYAPQPSRGKEKASDEFRVDADVEYNRLLVWANEIEYDEVMNLLVKLGEIPPEGGNTSTIRVLDVVPGPEREKLLERILTVWPSLAPNLLIPPEEPEGDESEEEEKREEAAEDESEEKASSKSRPATAAGASAPAGGLKLVESRSEGSRAVVGEPGRPVFQLALLEQETGESGAGSPSGESPEQEALQPETLEESKDQPASEASPAEPSKESEAPLEEESITEETPVAAEPQPQQEAGQAEASQEAMEAQPTPSAEPNGASPEAAPKSDQPASATAPADGAATPPPISITEAPDGRLIITSQDTKALDELEELIGRLSPQRKEYEVFKLIHAEAYWVKWNLEDFFEEEEKSDTSSSRYDYYYWGYPSSSGSKDTSRRLSRRRPLRFISDDDTNTILVQGATPDQLATIGELIELYDQRPSMDSESARRTEVFLIRYSEADVVAEAVKEVYRDLLSDRDKALASNRPDQQQRQESRYSYTYVFGDEEGERKMPRWKGYLSIGIDSLSNTLIVSAPEFLFRDIEKLITELDEAAKPSDSVGLVQLGKGVSASVVQEALGKVLSESAAGGKRAQAGAETPGQNGPRRSNGRNGRPGN